MERVVLAELFTASWCGYCPYATQALNKLAEEYGSSNQLVVLQYHTNSSDPLGNSETEARKIWYNIQHFPVLVLDGREYVGMQESETYTEYKKSVDARLAVASNVTLTLNGSVTDFGVTVYVNRTVEEATYKVRFVVFEDDVSYEALNGEKVFRFVVRDILEDEDVTLVQGQTLVFRRSFTPLGSWDQDKLGVAVFVQNDDTRDILQASGIFGLHGFSLFGSEVQKTVDKGDAANFTVQLIDTNRSGDIYDLAFSSSLPSGWSAEFFVSGVQSASTAEVALGSGETKNVTVKVNTSKERGRGNVTVRATSKSDSTLFASVTLLVEAVNPRYLVVFDSLPRKAYVTIDNRTAPPTQLPVPFLWENGSSHTFSASSELVEGNGARLVFRRWSDGATDLKRTIVVSGPAEYTAEFGAQVYLDLDSAYGDPQGEGWYDRDSTAAFSVTTQVDHGNMTRRVFLSWRGDVASTSAGGTVKMDEAKKITASWKTQYYLKVNSDVGDPKGESWYDGGGEAAASVTSPAGLIIQQVFVKWSGDSTAETSSITLRMNSPKVVTAVWRTDYTQLYLLGGGIFVVVVVILVMAIRRRGK